MILGGALQRSRPLPSELSYQSLLKRGIVCLAEFAVCVQFGLRERAGNSFDRCDDILPRYLPAPWIDYPPPYAVHQSKDGVLVTFLMVSTAPYLRPILVTIAGMDLDWESVKWKASGSQPFDLIFGDITKVVKVTSGDILRRRFPKPYIRQSLDH